MVSIIFHIEIATIKGHVTLYRQRIFRLIPRHRGPTISVDVVQHDLPYGDEAVGSRPVADHRRIVLK